jgi:hypothetical protein
VADRHSVVAMYCKFMERKRSRDGAMESQPNDLFTDSAMVMANNYWVVAMYCKFMEGKPSRDGAMESQPNVFFIDGAMKILNFKFHTWHITIRACPELPLPIRVLIFYVS